MGTGKFIGVVRSLDFVRSFHALLFDSQSKHLHPEGKRGAFLVR
ncbi:hypothetical protein MYAER_1458 [Microcystis aeruginosa NIES-2549]|uniref:Uncharacterized protein n=1 Tax=Microcystis aeruginosa NIES-2549 TaxID=1641812 RepID=A0A0F6U2P2_MICAE|nr:hypothetical protein MYAER_1458 [Microcystis aeruginosa NIES-2549]AOC52199.1 hypothetical protein amyaer_1468 [Microcystis aeruginosa NIES-2481]